MVKSFLLVGLGGSIGAMLRYLAVTTWKTETFPYNTLVVNIIGSILIGIVFAMSEKTDLINDNTKLFLATGICGGFTTFSTFSAENVALLKSGAYATAAGYIVASVTLCIVGTFIGFKIINN